MKILLVGGRSNLASALRPQLAPFSEVITAGREGCDVMLDLAAPADALHLPPGLDVVINTAAHFGGRSEEDILGCQQVNVLGLLALCRASRAAQVRQFVHISSIFSGLDCNSPFYSIYAMSKRHGEEASSHLAEQCGLPMLTLRPSQLYGVGTAFRRHQPFLYGLMDKAERGEDIVLFGRHDALRNFIHVEDVARVIARAVQQRLLGRYDCVAPENLTYSRIARAAITAFDSASRLSFAPEQPDIADNGFPANDALYQALGVHPQISIEAGMRMEVAYRQAQRSEQA